MSHIIDDIGLPEPVLQAIRRGGIKQRVPTSQHEDPAEFSVTDLLRPAWMAGLERRHRDDIEEKASSRIWALLGSSVHAILESAEQQPGDIVERRFVAEIEGARISGTPDYFCAATATLYDFKVTSSWSAIAGGKAEWAMQLNSYALLMFVNGIRVEHLAQCMILRDWSAMRAREGGNYPKAQAVVLAVELRPRMETTARLSERVAAHRGPASYCSPDERWGRPSEWAVMKNANKRATRVFDTEAEAVALAESAHRAEPKHEFRVVERAGDQWVRCRAYCGASPFCKPFQDQLVSENINQEAVQP